MPIDKSQIAATLRALCCAMSKKIKDSKPQEDASSGSKLAYKKALLDLQIELVKMQRHLIKSNDKMLIILEGRDASGKDGTIKHIVKHLSPRETRVVALSKPSDRDRNSWYFQRYVAHLPASQEFVLFNRSWYNRASVERVMGFCTKAEYKEFIASVPSFETMLVRSGIKFIKYYLDISKAEQKRRLHDRKTNLLKKRKMSQVDEKAIEHWKDYSEARNDMLAQTHTSTAPWTVVSANDKHLARLNVIKDMLHRTHYADKDELLIHPDPKIIFPYDASSLGNDQLEK
jgi:polyphosphate kinase 2